MAGYVTLRIKTDEAQAVAGFRKLTSAEQQATLEAGKLSKVNFKNPIKDLESWALRLISVTALIGTAMKAARDMNEERKRAAQEITGGAMARGQLSQLSGGDPAELRRMQRAARTSRLEGMPKDAAYQLQFGLESAGMASFRADFSNLYGVVTDPMMIAGGIKTIQDAMGKAETGSKRAILSKVFAGSKVALATAEEFAPAVASAAGGAALLGIRDEEVMAAIAQTSSAAGGAPEAGTRIAAIEKAMVRQGMVGVGLVEGVQQIAAKKMSPKELLKFLGRQEALSGYTNILQQAELIKGTTADLTAVGAGEGAYTAGLIKTHLSDPFNRADLLARREKEREKLAEEERLGPDALAKEAGRSRMRAESIETGEYGFTRWLKTAATDTTNFFGLKTYEQSTYEKEAQGDLPALEGGLTKVFHDFIEVIKDNTEAGRERVRLGRQGGE